MTQPQRSLKVFLCHAHADRAAVRALYTSLVTDGVDAWFDKEKILPGQDWELEIRKAVRESDVVIVCLSMQFNQAGFRQKEVRLALDTAMEKPEGDIFIIPARLEECDTLESLKKWHWVDLFDEGGYEKLLRALRTRGDRIGSITYSLMKVDIRAEKKRKAEFLLQQAEKLEKNAMWADALDVYTRIKGIDPSVVDLDNKLPDLRNKINSNNISKLSNKKLPVDPAGPKRFRWIMGVLALLTVCCVLLVVGGGIYASLNRTASEDQQALPVAATTEAPNSVLPEVVDMVLVPTGDFTMGSNAGVPADAPPHVVSLDALYMDIYETNTTQYQECVASGFCPRPWTDNSTTRPGYYANPEFANYPVIHVDWNMANAYCEWRGKRLPTEAEWEKSARGQANLIYPWGNEFDGVRLNFCDVNCPDSPNTNFEDGYDDTAPVDAYPQGVSMNGIYNLAGNVREWVQDQYDAYPGGVTTADSNFGLGWHVVRGGSWNENHLAAQTFARLAFAPDAVGDNTGFRCAKDVP